MAGQGVLQEEHLLSFENNEKWECIGQALANCGPGAICGPLLFLMQPAELEEIILFGMWSKKISAFHNLFQSHFD